MRKEHLKLTEPEQSYLRTLTKSGQLKARKLRRVMALLMLNEGKTMRDVSRTLNFSYPRVVALRDNYLENGLDSLEEKPRTGRPVEFDGKTRAKITALACTTAPLGHARWSLRLLAERIVELEICPSISHQQVKDVLKKTDSSHI